MRKPRRFTLINGPTGFHLVAATRGQKVFYLRPNDYENEHNWIQGGRKLKALIRWLKEVERYQAKEGSAK